MASFPKQERDPFCGLVGHPSNLDFRACFEGDTLVGLYAVLCVGDLAHVQFLAVEERYRDEGFGSKILSEIKERYAGHRIFVDIEEPDEASPNHRQRLRRVHFYAENGFVDAGIRYRWRGLDYRILLFRGGADGGPSTSSGTAVAAEPVEASTGAQLTREEFVRFWDAYEDTPGSLFPSHCLG